MTVPARQDRADLQFAKGHGTENDFVLVPDLRDELEISAADVRLLCDRRAGVGGDGLIRVVPRRIDGVDGWFMDYRNADGSISQMCGNGVRVICAYLLEHDLADPTEVTIHTRSGVRRTVRHDQDGAAPLYSVDMGPARDLGTSWARVLGTETPGRAVSMGNPHLVCRIDAAALDDLDLSDSPRYDPAVFPDGVNVEFYADATPLAGRYARHVRMRVYERGVGETRSCGTGICAVAHAVLHRDGHNSGAVTVDVPGGRLYVDVTAASIVLSGPAVLTAEGRTSLLKTVG